MYLKKIIFLADNDFNIAELQLCSCDQNHRLSLKIFIEVLQIIKI